MSVSLIVYRKYINNELIFKLMSSYPICKEVGFTNGYGWTILSIQCFINVRFYNIDTYRKIINDMLKDNFNKKLIKKKHFDILQFIYDLTR